MTTEAHTLHKPRRARRLAGRSATVAAVAAVLTVGGIAAANWAIDGEGTGTADATTVENLDVTLSADGALYPGATVDGTLTVTNDNPFPVIISAVVFDGAVIVGTPAGDCTSVNSEVTFTDATGLSIEVAAETTAEPFVGALVGAIAMGGGSDDACQGKTFTKDFTVTAAIDTTP